MGPKASSSVVRVDELPPLCLDAVVLREGYREKARSVK
jgi:hypothetical protein